MHARGMCGRQLVISVTVPTVNTTAVAGSMVTDYNRMANTDGDGGGGGGETNMGYSHDEPRRKVSINQDAIHADVERQRKISSTSNSSSHRKSILVNGDRQHYTDPSYVKPPHLEHRHILEHMYTQNEKLSWWYLFCTKCRQKETGPGWEPPFWQSICPYPFCPHYRHIARVISLLCIGILIWGILYSVIGNDAAPGGQLCDIAMLCIAGHIGGWVFRMINLPGLVGMLFVGIVYQNIGLIHIHGSYQTFVSILRRVALTIILTRAGLDLDPVAMKRLFWTILKIGLVPWFIECVLAGLSAYFFLGLPLMWALLLGGIIGAVSPAVVVPCLFRLRTKGYGVAKGIPTLIIAIAGIDDAASVAAFGIVFSFMFSEHSLLYNIIVGPTSVVCGVILGILWGLLGRYIPEKGDPFVVPMRILMLLGGGLIFIFGSEMIELGGAGPLAVVAAAFVSSWVWSTLGWEIEDNPVATAFEIFWMIFEPILFTLTGTQIRIHELDPHTFGIGLICLLVGAVLRIIVTAFICFGAKLNIKEKIFTSIALMAKASVQAALGPVALDAVIRSGHTSDIRYAEIVSMLCITSIVLTAPTGAILITLTGTRLLTKTIPGPPEGWRRSARPSLRDISIIDEEPENESNSEKGDNRTTEQAHQFPPNIVVTTQPT